jgi:hypothetical protein
MIVPGQSVGRNCTLTYDAFPPRCPARVWDAEGRQGTTPQRCSAGLWTSTALNPLSVSEVHQPMPEPPARPHRHADTSDHRTARLQPSEGPAGSNINLIIVSGHARVTVSNLGTATAEVGKPTRPSVWSYVGTACRLLAKLIGNMVSLAAAAVTVWLGLR